MSCLNYRGTELFIENVSLTSIAQKFDTPCYVYSANAIRTNWRTFDEAFAAIPHRICYAVKANSNIHILRLLAKLNSGFDIVSLGELERVLAAGGDPKKIIFSGVGKSEMEIKQAIAKGIYCFNVESEPELTRLNMFAEAADTKINIALRINPNIDAGTHAHISTGMKENKFGIEMEDVIPLCKSLSGYPALELIGVASHIGSQITTLEPFLLALDSLLDLYDKLLAMDIQLQNIDIGGGLGITYRDESPPAIREYAESLEAKIKNYPVQIILEPGRAIVGNAGVLLTKVEYLKHNRDKNFAIVDAGMNDLIRPALYEAWQNILPVTLNLSGEEKLYDIAGPVCESADFLGKHRKLVLHPGDLLAIDSAGAYAFSMSSNYNSRCKPIEVLVDSNDVKIIRRRETIEELFAAEKENYSTSVEAE